MINTTPSVLKKLLILFLVFAGLYYAKDFLIPLAIGTVLATLFLPMCKWLEEKKLPKALAALLCLLALLLVIAGITSLLIWQIADLATDVELIREKALETLIAVQQYLINHLGISAERQLQFIKNEQSSFAGLMQTMAGSLTYIFTSCILVLAYIFLLLYYKGHLRKFFVKLFPAEQQEEMEDVVDSAAHVSQQYIVGLSKMIFCLWIMYSIGFSIAGVDNPVLFAVICGLLEIIPFVGNFTGSSLTLLVSAVHGAGLPMLAGIALTYGIVQFIQGWVLEPLIVGRQVKINPLFTIIALVIGELVWGIPGIILAIPLTAIFKIVCDHVDELKPYGFLIGEIETVKSEPDFIIKIKSWFKNKAAN